MKLIIHFCALLLICSTAHIAGGQTVGAKKDGWSRVQTDTGELSVEVPEDFAYFFDLDGFTVGQNSNDYPVKDMRLLNAYRTGTLVSLEVYRAGSNAMMALLESTMDKGFRKKKTTFQGFDVREIAKTEEKDSKSEPFYFVSRYFRSNELFIYSPAYLEAPGRRRNCPGFSNL